MPPHLLVAGRGLGRKLKGASDMNKLTIPRVCEHCSTPFLANKYDVSKGWGRFCSKVCKNASLGPPPTIRDCEVCSLPFLVPMTEIRKGWGRFCSKACANTAQSVPAKTRFWQHVSKSETCWLWTTGTDKDGYGKLKDGDRHLRAHRYSWELHFGPIPEGQMVLHKCDNPPCVNPSHLFLGDAMVNNLDCKSKGRSRNGYSGKLAAP